MREAVQGKNFVKGLPEVYLCKLSLLKTKPEYVWLGDYPKEAEQRKQGFNTLAAGAPLKRRVRQCTGAGCGVACGAVAPGLEKLTFGTSRDAGDASK